MINVSLTPNGKKIAAKVSKNITDKKSRLVALLKDKLSSLKVNETFDSFYFSLLFDKLQAKKVTLLLNENNRNYEITIIKNKDKESPYTLLLNEGDEANSKKCKSVAIIAMFNLLFSKKAIRNFKAAIDRNCTFGKLEDSKNLKIFYKYE